MATIYDVAERAEVSAGTVSRVINNHPSVRPATRKAVLQAIQELQYQPNPIARTLRTSKTRMIGVVVSDLMSATPITTSLWGAERAAQELGYALLLADSQMDPMVEARNIANLLERRVDGLICNPVASSRAIHELVAESGVPTVIYGWTVPNRVLPSVIFSESDAMREAVDHLIENGHRRIGVLTRGGARGTGSAFRRQQIRALLQEHGIVQGDEWHRSANMPAEGAAMAVDLLQLSERPTALFVTGGSLVPHALIGIREAGLRVPDDLSLVCVDDSDWLQAVTPPLNTITLDIGAHVEAATRLAIDLVEHRDSVSRTIEHQARYLRRGSVGRAG